MNFLMIELFKEYFQKTEGDNHPHCYAGDRFVCLVPCRLNSYAPMTYTVAVLTATETGWENEDGWTMEEAVAWCPEPEFHKAAVSVFGELPGRIANGA